MSVSDEIHAETVKENRRLRKEISRLKDENRFLEEQMVARTRDHVETSRREAQRRAAALFLNCGNED